MNGKGTAPRRWPAAAVAAAEAAMLLGIACEAWGLATSRDAGGLAWLAASPCSWAAIVGLACAVWALAGRTRGAWHAAVAALGVLLVLSVPACAWLAAETVGR